MLLNITAGAWIKSCQKQPTQLEIIHKPFVMTERKRSLNTRGLILSKSIAPGKRNLTAAWVFHASL